MDDIIQRIVPVIAEKLGVEQNEIQPDTAFAEDLGCDSLDAVELLMAAEDEFRIRLGDDVFGKIKTVGDAVGVIREAVKVRDMTEMERREAEARELARLEPLFAASEKEEFKIGLGYAKRTGLPYFTHDGRKAGENRDSLRLQMSEAIENGTADEKARGLASVALGMTVGDVTGDTASELCGRLFSSRCETNDFYFRWISDVRYKNGSHNAVFPDGTVVDSGLVRDAAEASLCQILTMALLKQFRKISFPVTYFSRNGDGTTEEFSFCRVGFFDEDDPSFLLLGVSKSRTGGKERDVVLKVRLESGRLSRVIVVKEQKASPAGKSAARLYRKLYLFLSGFWNGALRSFVNERLSYCFGITKAQMSLRTYAKLYRYNQMAVNYTEESFALEDGRVRPSGCMLDDSYTCISNIQKLMLRKGYAMDVLYGLEKLVLQPNDLLLQSADQLVFQGELFNPKTYASRSAAFRWAVGSRELYEVNPETLYKLRRDEEPAVLIGNDRTGRSVKALLSFMNRRLAIIEKTK